LEEWKIITISVCVGIGVLAIVIVVIVTLLNNNIPAAADYAEPKTDDTTEYDNAPATFSDKAVIVTE
jgi:hypothetical protein